MGTSREWVIREEDLLRLLGDVQADVETAALRARIEVHPHLGGSALLSTTPEEVGAGTTWTCGEFDFGEGATLAAGPRNTFADGMREAARLIQLWQSFEPAHSVLHAVHQRDASRIIGFWPARLREFAGDADLQQPAASGAATGREALLAESAQSTLNPALPFSNCQFRICDLPGQCRSAGRCHHPARVERSDGVVMPRELSEEMVRAALAVCWPSLYREALFNDGDGANMRAETTARANTVAQQYRAIQRAAIAFTNNPHMAHTPTVHNQKT